MISDLLSQYGYHGFLAVGAVSMLVLTLYRKEQYNLSTIAAVVFPFVLLICGVSGAKLLYFVESGFDSFEGMSFFGAVYLVMLVMPLAGLLFQLRPSQTLDACAPCVASIIGFMRFGCFCAGCCGGTLCSIGTHSFRWPTQMLEGFGDMLILLLLLNCEQQQKKDGLLYPIFLLTYGIMRFVIEFLRDTPKIILRLSEGQWLSLISILVGMLWLYGAEKRRKPNGRNA